MPERPRPDHPLIPGRRVLRGVLPDRRQRRLSESGLPRSLLQFAVLANEHRAELQLPSPLSQAVPRRGPLRAAVNVTKAWSSASLRLDR